MFFQVSSLTRSILYCVNILTYNCVIHDSSLDIKCKYYIILAIMVFHRQQRPYHTSQKRPEAANTELKKFAR